MRIIAGRLKSRQFDAPPGQKTHPMSEKMRGALFSALGDIEGLNVLDVFAGSGALGFEAVSRGAASAVSVESDKKAQRVIKQNIQKLGLTNEIRLIAANASSWSKNNSEAEFDIVILDPPYGNAKGRVLESIAGHARVGGIAVFSLPPGFRLGLPASAFRHLITKPYNDSQLVFYRRVK